VTKLQHDYNGLKNKKYLYKIYQNSIVFKNYQICTKCTKQNKCIIKGIIRWKYLRDLRKLFKYQHSQWL